MTTDLQTATAADWQALRDCLERFLFRGYPERRGRLLAEATRRAQRWEVVFRPIATAAWELGYAGDSKPYNGAPTLLWAAYRAICGEPDVCATSYVRPGTRHAANSVRTGLRDAAKWVERCCACAPLVDVLHHVRVIAGMIVYDPAPGAPRVVV